MYKYRPIEEAKPGDIVEFVDNSGNKTGTPHIVGKVSLGGFCDLVPPLKSMATPQQHRFKLIETKPGSEAQVGDTVIRISSGTESMPTGGTFKVLNVKGISLSYSKERAALVSECLVLCKEDEQQPKHQLSMAKHTHRGWFVKSLVKNKYYLRQDITVQDSTGWSDGTNIGYWETEAEANFARAQYLGEQMEPELEIGMQIMYNDDAKTELKAYEPGLIGAIEDIVDRGSQSPLIMYITPTGKPSAIDSLWIKPYEPEIKVGSHWERIANEYPNYYVGEIILISSSSPYYISWDEGLYGFSKKTFLERFKPRPDLDQPTVHSNVEPQPTTKEQPMRLDLKLLTAIMAAIAASTEVEQDATNSKFLCVLTKDNNYEGYFYANTEDEYTKVMQKVENAEKKLHVFEYKATVAQKPRKIVEVERV